jgi:hypothetical protein
MSVRSPLRANNLDCETKERKLPILRNRTPPTRLYEWLNEGRTAELVYSVYDIISWHRFHTEQG